MQQEKWTTNTFAGENGLGVTLADRADFPEKLSRSLLGPKSKPIRAKV